MKTVTANNAGIYTMKCNPQGMKANVVLQEITITHITTSRRCIHTCTWAAAARNAPSQCHQQPGIRGADATPVRPHVRASNLQQRSSQIHRAPIGQSQSQWHHMGIRHRYGDVHAAERCRSHVDGTVQHKPLNRYQQPTPDTRHHRTIPNYSSPYGNTNTYRLPNRQESHLGYQHLPAISQRDRHQHNMPERHLTDEHRTERSRLDRNLPAISQRDGYQHNMPERHITDEHRTERSRLDRNLPAISQRDGYQHNMPESHITDEHRTERSRLDRNLPAISQRDGYQHNMPERHITDEHRTERSRLDRNLPAISQRDGYQHNMPERHITDEHRTERSRLDRNLPEISQRDGYQHNMPERHITDEHRTERSRLDRNLPAISQRDGYQHNMPERHITDEHRTERSRLDRTLPEIRQRDGHQLNMLERHVRDEHMFHTHSPDISLTGRHINDRRHLDGHRSDGHCPNTTRIRYANERNAESAPLTKEVATQTSISNSEASTQTNNVNKIESSTLSPSSAAQIISTPLEKIQLEPPRRQAKLIISPALIKGVVLKKVKKII